MEQGAPRIFIAGAPVPLMLAVNLYVTAETWRSGLKPLDSGLLEFRMWGLRIRGVSWGGVGCTS